MYHSALDSKPAADANAFLIGMVVKNATRGEGIVTRTYEGNTEYCDITFEANRGTHRYRIDLLSGWGGYFVDSTTEIVERQSAWKYRITDKPRVAAVARADSAEQQAWRTNDGTLQTAMIARQTRDGTAMRALLHAGNIPHLLHFTRIENLDRILREGIVPRAKLSAGSFIANDLIREDGFSDASSLSIGFPNYKMLFKYRCHVPDDCAGWAVVAIAPTALLDFPCLFYQTNAAAHESRRLAQTNVSSLMGAAGLQAMFAEPSVGLRNRLGLPGCYTTDPQAEVLAFGKIGPEYFTGIALHSAANRNEVETRIRTLQPSMPIRNRSGWFDGRHDREFWKSLRITQLHTER